MWWCCQCEAMRELDKHGRCGTCGSEAVTHPEPIAVNWPANSVRCDDLERLYRLGAI